MMDIYDEFHIILPYSQMEEEGGGRHIGFYLSFYFIISL